MVRLLWPDGFDERMQVEAGWRGYLSHVRVELDDGRVFPVLFISAVRLQQDLEASQPPMIAEVGMIVLPEVTCNAMEAAVTALAGRRFFEYLRPLEGDDDRPWEW